MIPKSVHRMATVQRADAGERPRLRRQMKGLDATDTGIQTHRVIGVASSMDWITLLRHDFRAGIGFSSPRPRRRRISHRPKTGPYPRLHTSSLQNKNSRLSRHPACSFYQDISYARCSRMGVLCAIAMHRPVLLRGMHCRLLPSPCTSPTRQLRNSLFPGAKAIRWNSAVEVVVVLVINCARDRRRLHLA